MEWKRRGDDSIPAMPNLDDLLSVERLASIESGLRELCQPFFDTSVVVVRDVKRIPLKIVDSNDELEQVHLESSCDGLRFFRPVDIYSDNVVHAQGLLAVTRTCNNLRGLAPIHIVHLVTTHSSMWMSRSSGSCSGYCRDAT